MRLGQKFTREILAGKRPALTDEQVEQGQVVVLREDQVWITVGQRVKANRWSYSVRDDRPRFMRQVPHGGVASKPKRREDESQESYDRRVAAWKRRVHRDPTKEEIARATEEGGYTHSPEQALDKAEAVEPDVQKRLAQEARARESYRREEQEERQRKLTVERRLADARKRGGRGGKDISSELRVIERQIAKIERKVQEAA